MGEGFDLEFDERDFVEPSPASIRAELETILTSHAFHAAHAQKAFLRFVVEETIAGRGHRIKESTIGIEALRRGESFDPRLDPLCADSGCQTANPARQILRQRR